MIDIIEPPFRLLSYILAVPSFRISYFYYFYQLNELILCVSRFQEEIRPSSNLLSRSLFT